MTVAGLLDHVALLDLLRADNFDLLVGHVVIVLISLHLIRLVAGAGDPSRPRRRDRLRGCGRLTP